MKNRVLRLLLTFGVVAGLAVSAFATDHQGSQDWLVTFDGTQMKQNFSSTSMADSFSGESIQPGDTITMKVSIKNTYDGKTDWYMSNAVVASFEDTGTASGSTKSSAYTYTLTYYPPSGSSQLLYNSHDVGGDVQDYTTTRGMGEATEGLKDFFKLDTLSKDQSGYLTLVVHLDGETEGNSYQDTLAKLKMNFAVELNEEEEPDTPSTTTTTPPSEPTTPSNNTTTPRSSSTRSTTPTPTNNTTTPTTTSNRSAVRTGDEFHLVPYLAAACVSGLLLLAIVIFLVKRKAVKNERGAD
jgi:hypothetical protein